MSIALDIGAHQLRSLRQKGESLVGLSTRSVYSILPNEDSQKRVLEQSQVPYAVCDDNLILMGDPAVELSQLFQAQHIQLLPAGQIPKDDPLSRQILASLVDSLLPEPKEVDEICCLTLPGTAIEQSATKNPERDFFTQLVRLRGYRPLILSSGMALILAELVKQQFTGIGMVFGRSCCEVVVAQQGTELARCVVMPGGDWIDEEFARKCDDFSWNVQGEQFLDVGCASRRKELFSGKITEPESGEEKHLALLYRNKLNTVLRRVSRELSVGHELDSIKGPISVVCAGGTARVNGFEELVGETIESVSFPLDVQDIRVVTDSKYTIARGCLINAELENETLLQQQAA